MDLIQQLQRIAERARQRERERRPNFRLKPLQINRLLLIELLKVLFMIHQVLVSTRTLEEPIFFNRMAVTDVKK